MESILEIIAFDLESCRLIEKHGGNRIELCANPHEGGTTVSYGMMRAAREATTLPIFPIIRPRGGNFHYSESEIDIMMQDIRLARDTGLDGVVIGVLDAAGAVDYDKTARMVELAYPMEVTFHRAFDEIADYLPALETIIRAGCNRILTSGGAPTAPEGIDRLKACVQSADGRIIILPGAGIRSHNIGQLKTGLGLSEFHSSARKLDEKTGTYSVDVHEIIALRAAVDA
ncbi:copper homeostasis protein CutC [Flavihumibacter petaseus]|uniref:PF03932 family protein CutC n=1 Tax=Flavihumibacter petaseus NBRC 106054 TaxID=1220578 RepID=A0A0E9N104_9BACT|nr:copper homeostasis protein CutC [Flavihumibacter petaseus]GAO43697.1 copper homeostasis protein CutC [Flavihumibacter petaseus NBRC 106054]